MGSIHAKPDSAASSLDVAGGRRNASRASVGDAGRAGGVHPPATIPVAPSDSRPESLELSAASLHEHLDDNTIVLRKIMEARKEVVPTVFRWEHGGNDVYITGTFNNWAEKAPMHRSGNDFTYIHELRREKHMYKFIVDNQWRYAHDQPTVYDAHGNVNNFVDMSQFRPYEEEEEGGAHRERSSSAEFGHLMPDIDDYTKEPPPLPPHLRHIILNLPAPSEDPRELPTPMHVTLNHLHCTAIKDRLMVLGMTHRYRRKFVTTVYYSWLTA